VDGSRRVKRQVVVAAPPADVWAALTQSDHLSAWFGAAAETQPDGSVTFRWSDGTVRRAVIDVSERERLLILRWLPYERSAAGRVFQRPATRVVFTLTPLAEGTLLRVVEATVGSLESNVLSAAAVQG
jgi:uncharacterized protein YndB with AHSA1/START domain